MKKTLVTLLALVFVLGIAGTALAAPANPFVDVPAKHWAYGAVAQLAKAGIVDGYGDGTFRGDRAMTRYEMAQVVAKAMAKSDKADAENKALIDKLAVEFAAELNNLGVRVAKLEKNASTIKFNGDARVRYLRTENGTTNPTFGQRFQLYANAEVNENTLFSARWVVLNHNVFGTYNNNSATQQTTNLLSDANLTAKNILPNIDAKVGRYSLALGQTAIFAGSTGGFDGLEFMWKFGKANMSLAYADSALLYNTSYVAAASSFNNAGNVYYSQLNYKFDDTFKANLFFVKNQDQGVAANKVINAMGIGFTWNLDKDWAFVGDYWRNGADAAKLAFNGKTPKAYVARIQYKALKPAVPGSWMAFVEYLKAEPGANDSNWTGAMLGSVTNVKAWDVQWSYTMAKNVTFDAIYQFNAKTADTGASKFANNGTAFTRLQFNFLF